MQGFAIDYAAVTNALSVLHLCQTIPLTSRKWIQREPLLNKLVYFLRSNPKGVSDKACEQDIVAGELSRESLDNYGTLLSELYIPVFKEQGNWGKSDTEHTHQFLQVSPICEESTACDAIRNNIHTC